MYRRRAMLFAIGGLFLSSVPSSAQRPHALVGSWERFSLKDSVGLVIQPPLAAAFVVFTADGFYSQSAIPKNRPKVAKPLAQLTRDELLARYTNAESRWGRYSIAGDTLTRTYEASLNPNNEGGPPQVQRFRIEGDVLILTSVRPGMQNEARFRRVR